MGRAALFDVGFFAGDTAFFFDVVFFVAFFAGVAGIFMPGIPGMPGIVCLVVS